MEVVNSGRARGSQRPFAKDRYGRSESLGPIVRASDITNECDRTKSRLESLPRLQPKSDTPDQRLRRGLLLGGNLAKDSRLGLFNFVIRHDEMLVIQFDLVECPALLVGVGGRGDRSG